MTTEAASPATFDLPPDIETEIQTYEAHVRRFQRDEIDPLEFRLFRLQHGIYGQRQADVQMVRVKIPYGGLNGAQLETLADIAERFAPRQVGHLTTRQDMQLHFIPLVDTPTIMRMLAAVGLTTREACGNTVRNVTADHLSGVAPGDAFDVTPYAKAVSAHCLRLDVAQQLPRKFKPAFSASDDDRGLIPMHDIGYLARLRVLDGRAEHGFKVVVGGGLGAAPHVAPTLYEYLPAAEIVRVTEAVLRVFNANGQRKNRNKARIKFYVKQVGIEQFRLQVEEELEQMPPAGDPHFVQPSQFAQLEETVPAAAPRLVQRADLATPEYREWRRTNVTGQIQDGFFSAFATVPLGDLTVAQMRGLASLAREFAADGLRITVSQGIVFRWLREADLPDLYLRLGQLDLDDAGAETLADVMSCPGADTCALGITSSKGLSRVLHESLQERADTDPGVERVRIKISGCPNSCGHHHVGDIGLQGVSLHADGRLAPGFLIFLGGRIDREGASIGRPVTKVPARRVPAAVNLLLDDYASGHEDGEGFRAYTGRQGLKYFRALLDTSGLTATPKFTENPLEFVDNDAAKLFSLDEMGEGECAV